MAVVLGKGVKPEKAEKFLDKWADRLVDGEEVWFYAKCNNLKPMTDAVVITNVRVFWLSSNLGYQMYVVHSDIAAVSCKPNAGRSVVEVLSSDGVRSFKQVDEADLRLIDYYISYGRQLQVPAHVLRAVAEAPTPPGEKAKLKAERREQRELDKVEEEERYGRKVAHEMFGWHTVRIYDKGYVRVSIPGLGSNTPFERLLAIEGSADVQKKTGLGRGVAFVATGGVNMLSPNKRGDVYLTITTDRTTHVLHEDPPSAQNMKQVKRLEAAGNAVIGRGGGDGAPSAATASPPPTPEPTPPAVAAPSDGPRAASANRLREIAQLRDEGLISPEEYAELRAKVLGDL